MSLDQKMTAQPYAAQPARRSGELVETDIGRLFVESAGTGPAPRAPAERTGPRAAAARRKRKGKSQPHLRQAKLCASTPRTVAFEDLEARFQAIARVGQRLTEKEAT